MQVMIVDDSKTMRMIVVRTLKKAGFSDHTFLEASDGAEAFKMIQENVPDLVLSNWNMPEMNGIELLQKTKEADIDVRMGFITTESTKDIRAQATEAGALFFITKPFTPETFELTLETILV